MTLEDLFSEIRTVDFNDLKKGQVVRKFDDDGDNFIAKKISVDHMRELITNLSDLYKKGKPPTPKQFQTMFDKFHARGVDKIHDTINQLERSEDLFRVVERKKVKGGFQITVKKIDMTERLKLIKSITEKLLKKIKPEQLTSLFEEGIRKNTDIDDLKKIDKELDKKEPKIEDSKGCFKMTVGDCDLITLY